jgi:hypothetical protein
MLVSATATIALDGWPPPTIEIHALLAALGDCGHEAQAGPATAFQHLNEVDISFAFELPNGVRADSRAQQIALETMARVYAGPIHVHVDVVEAVVPGPLTTTQSTGRTVVDLTEVPGDVDSELACAATGCQGTAAVYEVRVTTVSAADGELELTMPLCARHAEALGKRAVSRTPL